MFLMVVTQDVFYLYAEVTTLCLSAGETLKRKDIVVVPLIIVLRYEMAAHYVVFCLATDEWFAMLRHMLETSLVPPQTLYCGFSLNQWTWTEIGKQMEHAPHVWLCEYKPKQLRKKYELPKLPPWRDIVAGPTTQVTRLINLWWNDTLLMVICRILLAGSQSGAPVRWNTMFMI